MIVLDKRDIGQGSTCASTALLQYELDTELTELAQRLGEERAARCWRLGLEAIGASWRVDRQSLPADCGFARRPSLYRASRSGHVGPLKAEFELRQHLGFAIEWWDTERLADTCFPAPAAIYSRGDGEVDAYRLAHALLARASEHGARVHDRTTRHCSVEPDRRAAAAGDGPRPGQQPRGGLLHGLRIGRAPAASGGAAAKHVRPGHGAVRRHPAVARAVPGVGDIAALHLPAADAR